MLTLANPHTITDKIIIKGIEIKLNKSKGQIIWQINKEKRNLEKQFAKIISDISKEELNHAVVLKQIGELRENLSKLDLLLIETSDVVNVCQQGLAGNYNIEDEEQEIKQKVEQEVKQETLPAQALQTMQLQDAYKNIQNITGELKRIKKNNA